MEKQPQQPTSPPQWPAHLRERFVEIASRRVPEHVVEDLVHDAMGIVLTKGPAEARKTGAAEPPLRWSFLVLRNVIGNYYQKRRRHEPLDGIDCPDDTPDALCLLTRDEKNRTIHAALEALKERSADCARWLWTVARGTRPGVLARREGLDESLFYRRLYRCRQTLGEILKEKGVRG